MSKNMNDSYIYFGTRYGAGEVAFTKLYENWIARGYSEAKAKDWVADARLIKVGETANIYQRSNSLRCNEDTWIKRYVHFQGTKDERLFVESYIRSKYAANRNMEHCGNDHFYCRTSKTIKGAENKFFIYVAEAFALLEQIKGKTFNYECHTK